MIATAWLRLRAVLALGLLNVWRVLWYRLQLRFGVHPAQRLGDPPVTRGPFFAAPRALVADRDASTAWLGRAEYFGWFRPALDGLPDWHANAFAGTRSSAASAPWWTIPDFDPAVGDIKTLWEPSRFDWLLASATRAARGDSDALSQMNDWLDAWAQQNPPYRGANWKCGQEASIRVLHLATAALVLDTVQAPLPSLVTLLEQHCARIAPTTSYAIGQDNNHGTSEAAALFVAGSWLAQLGRESGTAYARAGRALLQDRVARLIQPDGSFSQHSLNYHRLVLDTVSLVELWRRRLRLPAFAPVVVTRAAAATRWLHAFVDPVTGDAPVLGANDGANLLPLTDAGYRDYRPAVHLAAALFLDRAAYPDAALCVQHLAWLGLAAPTTPLEAVRTTVFDNGGIAVLVAGSAHALLRYPRFRFRPGHTDALHVDLRVGTDNILRDGGSFSYNHGPEWAAYFTGAAGHNSVQFDGREQMPKVGRFLWGAWLQTERRSEAVTVTDHGQQFSASYVDWRGARHARTITLSATSLHVADDISGFASTALLRWRLAPGEWTQDGTTFRSASGRITVSADVAISRVALVDGWESRFYLQKTPLPVIEVEVREAGRLFTHVEWTS